MQTIFNTLSRTIEPFKTLEPNKVKMYSCGATVYDYIHIGNARTFTTFDMVYRWLMASGYAVNYARNITDIDDKIIERARENNEPFNVLAERMALAMQADCARLKLLPPSEEPLATAHIDGMLEIIAMLEQKGLAYRAANGDVYYSVRGFEGYGKLSKKTLDDLQAGERVAVDTNKRDPFDFVLWKAAKPNEPQWQSIFGGGRPGWHIECSAMCRSLFGPQLDIHGGGWDLQFPHHENEIAQSEGALGLTPAKPFVGTWMHAAFLNMDTEKMSKSLGNFFTLREVLNKLDAVQGGETVRYFLLRGHYRSEINYTWEILEEARQSLMGFYIALNEVATMAVDKIDWSQPYAQRFQAAMCADFDTPAAFAILHEMRRELNRSKSPELAGLLKALGGTLGFFQDNPAEFARGAAAAGLGEEQINALIAERAAAKLAKDFARGDAIRKELDVAGVILEDKPGGVTLWRKK